MAIFSVSDVIISATLLINALALLSSRIRALGGASHPKKAVTESSSFLRLAQAASRRANNVDGRSGDADVAGDSESDALLSSSATANTRMDGADTSVNGEHISSAVLGVSEAAAQDAKAEAEQFSVSARLRKLVYGVRRYSCIIVMWNLIFSILMIFVFGRSDR